jgi:hypothetical protein
MNMVNFDMAMTPSDSTAPVFNLDLGIEDNATKLYLFVPIFIIHHHALTTYRSLSAPFNRLQIILNPATTHSSSCTAMKWYWGTWLLIAAGGAAFWYRNELLVIRRVMAAGAQLVGERIHASRPQEKSPRISLRAWLRRHCCKWGETDTEESHEEDTSDEEDETDGHGDGDTEDALDSENESHGHVKLDDGDTLCDEDSASETVVDDSYQSQLGHVRQFPV